MDGLTFLDKLRTQIRLFLMENREIILLFGVLFLTASVIYSTRIISFPTRIPTRATESGGPTPTLVPTITTISTPVTFPTSSAGGFLELLQLSPTEPTSSTTGGSGGPLPTPQPEADHPLDGTPIPSSSDGTIFLPPVQR